MTETKTYVWCGNCQCHFSDFYKNFRQCPFCRSALNVMYLTGENLPDILPMELRLAKQEN